MGFFQSLFHHKGHNNKKGCATPNPMMAPNQPQPNVATSSEKPPMETRQSSRRSSHSNHSQISAHHIMPPSITSPKMSSSALTTSNSTKTTSTKSSLKSPSVSRRGSAEHISRFLLLDNGTHVHHLTMPAQSKIAASLNGLVTGIANKSLKLTQWTEKKLTLEEIKKERSALDYRLHRSPETLTLAEKWGTCQETIGKGTCGVVRLAHKIEGGTERLYAIKVSVLKKGPCPHRIKTRFYIRKCEESLMKNLKIISID